MRYRDARLLKAGDIILSKETKAEHIIETVEVYGKDKPIRINCQANIVFWHTEVDDYRRS